MPKATMKNEIHDFSFMERERKRERMRVRAIRIRLAKRLFLALVGIALSMVAGKHFL